MAGRGEGLGLYIHWPFCVVKCPYCDFNSHVRKDVRGEEWGEGLRGELEHLAYYLGDRKLETLYFGGGTPSLMPWRVTEDLIGAAKSFFCGGEDVEVTLEANPGTFDESRFEGYAKAGVTRLSLGVQSFVEEKLKFLGRVHDVASAKRALKRSGELFSRVSFDMIYGVPEEGVGCWREELGEGLALAEKWGVGHMSLYQLTIEAGTAFSTWHRKGKWKMPCVDEQADFYDVTGELMREGGFERYEVSNYARGEGEMSRHNVRVWNYEDYGGVGPGAHGRLRKGGKRYRTVNKRLPERWLLAQKERGLGYEEWEEVGSKEAFEEALMMGLRLYEGIEESSLEEMRGCTFAEMFEDGVWEMLEEGGDVKREGGRLRATKEGMKRLDGVLGRLLTGIRRREG